MRGRNRRERGGVGKVDGRVRQIQKVQLEGLGHGVCMGTNSQWGPWA